MSDDYSSRDIYSEKAARLRTERINDMTLKLVASEGQPLRAFMLTYSKETGRSLKTLGEYWEVISLDNKGPIYEHNGIIKVRKSSKRRLLMK